MNVNPNAYAMLVLSLAESQVFSFDPHFSIYRDYDIRGVYPSEVNFDNIRLAANAAVRYLNAKTLIVGQDVRMSSENLRFAVIDGATSAGCDVIFIGQVSTPLFYFAVNTLNNGQSVGGGIMITASHNPPQYNGIKIVGPRCMPIDQETGLGEIRRLASESFYQGHERGQSDYHIRIADEYIDFLARNSNFGDNPPPFKIIVDAGGGAASIITKPLFDRLKINYRPLLFDIDSTLSNRDPNPLAPGALNNLSAQILKEKADLGIAYDSDADRMVVVDEKGKLVDAQYILALLWQRFPGRVVHDLRFSKSITGLFGGHGVRSKVGRSHLAQMMRLHQAGIGAETSGHFFFRDMNYMESPELAILGLLDVLSKKRKPLSELVKAFQTRSYSGEINLPIRSREAGEKIIADLKSDYSNGKIDELDGITVEFNDWWFNLRLSNTEPVIRLVVEADSEQLMEQKVNELKDKMG